MLKYLGVKNHDGCRLLSNGNDDSSSNNNNNNAYVLFFKMETRSVTQVEVQASVFSFSLHAMLFP